MPPGCEPACHGCRHRDWTPQDSLDQKQAYLARVLATWRDRIAPVHAAPPAQWLGYRDRVTLTARWQSDTGWRFGLMRRDELIAIHDCPVHTARVRGLVHRLIRTLPPGAQFPLAYLHVSGAQATLIVKSHRYDPRLLEPVLDDIAATGIEGLWIHRHPAAGRRLFARSGWTLAWGERESVDAQGLRHGPTSFQQLLPSLHARSLELAAAHLGPSPATPVLDLYCGHGASLRRWCAAGAAPLGVELAAGAIEAAAANAPAAQLLRGTCLQRLPQVIEWWHAQSGRPVVYANPPRSGLEPEVTQAVTEALRPPRFAYLSCSAGTLARDLQASVAAGYAVDALHPFDFFPLTHHVEVLALLTRR